MTIFDTETDRYLERLGASPRAATGTTFSSARAVLAAVRGSRVPRSAWAPSRRRRPSRSPSSEPSEGRNVDRRQGRGRRPGAGSGGAGDDRAHPRPVPHGFRRDVHRVRDLDRRRRRLVQADGRGPARRGGRRHAADPVRVAGRRLRGLPAERERDPPLATGRAGARTSGSAQTRPRGRSKGRATSRCACARTERPSARSSSRARGSTTRCARSEPSPVARDPFGELVQRGHRRGVPPGRVREAGTMTLDGREYTKLVTEDGLNAVLVDPDTGEPVAWIPSPEAFGVPTTVVRARETLPDDAETRRNLSLTELHPDAAVRDVSAAELRKRSWRSIRAADACRRRAGRAGSSRKRCRASCRPRRRRFRRGVRSRRRCRARPDRNGLGPCPGPRRTRS